MTAAFGDGSDLRVAADGTEFRVAVRGVGDPAVVLLHYFAGAGRARDAVAGRLADGRRCVAPDLRGHGGSAGPRLAVVPGVGHLVPLEAPAELAALIADALGSAFAKPGAGPA